MTTPISPLDTLRNRISFLYKNGDPKLRASALALEEEYNNKGIKLGSIITEEILESFVTQDPAMLDVKDKVRKLAYNNDPVLIFGPSGTGKSIIARALHGSRTGKFMQLNCTALTDELIASELFGHVKGSFTGAVTDKIGKLQAAAGGTVFLDEIGDMPMSMQTKLLKAVEEKVITRVGDNDEIKINCRFVGATNQPVSKLREDLYWRLSVFSLYLSPLCNRLDDIQLIARQIEPTFPINDLLMMQPTHQYPGNVREIITAIKRWKVYGELT